MVLDLVDVLKVDKDCMDAEWRPHYLRLIIETCGYYGVTVVWVKTCNSQHKGVHYYIGIQPPVEAKFTNMLQYLLGDDTQRVDHNRARIESGLNEWNKLFELPNRRLRTVYRRTDALSKSF